MFIAHYHLIYTFVHHLRLKFQRMDIFDKLIQIRKEKGKLQKELAYYLKISLTTMSRYEGKKRKIPYDLLILYAEFLKYDVRLLVK
jgi:transcriptional regulator with XRE-family HTH domain